MQASVERKDYIVRAAFAVLMRQGVRALDFKTVAKEAGLSRQLVRYYFADPDALSIALCDHLAGLYREALVSGAAQIDARDRLNFFLDFYFDLLGDAPKPRDDQAYDALFALAAGDPAVRQNLRTQYGLLGHVISHEMQVHRPELSVPDCQELSYLFVCLMYGHWKMVASLGYSEDHKHITRRAIDRLVQSYAAASGPAADACKAWSTDG
ncbi:TetR/AcrR family transcriptional regulator [Thalassococcus sp. BH17M4-6]|uniref:TetR/AcrR family transcriptional regulator n=1 Tax=Thalassococcus sp. BH17M4-6 TaxID=3413148 RepID=UPI003BF48C77